MRFIGLFVLKQVHLIFIALSLALGGIFQRNGNWGIDFYSGSRRVRQLGFQTKGEAKRALDVKKGEIAQGRFKFVPKRGAPTFDILADKYLNLVSIHKRGHNVERYIIKANLEPHFGKFRLSDLTKEDAEKYKTKRSQSVSAGTVNRELGLFKHMMAQAFEWELIVDNPFRGLRNLKVPKRDERVLAPDEDSRLLAACERVRARHLRRGIVLALNTGMRRGEILSLEWSRVDLKQRTIRIINAKSEAGDRVIPMNTTVHSLLSELAKTAKSPLVFPSNRKPGKKFLDLKKGFSKAVTLAGITHIRFHDLRHTFATRLVQAGVDIVTLQHLLGHSKITMTARYAHSLADAKMAAVSKLDFAGFCSSPDSNRTPTAISTQPEQGLSDLPPGT